MHIKNYGWNEYFQKIWNQLGHEHLIPARVIADFGQILLVVSEQGEMKVNRPLHKGEMEQQVAVGDWVALETLEESEGGIVVHSILPRKTKFSRAAAGVETKEQIVAANVDTVFLMQSLNKDFNMRRMERYLIAAWESGAMPVVVLGKADCCDTIEEKLRLVYQTAEGVPVHVISSVTGQGIDEIKEYCKEGKTIALLGSSGVGKSTLVNTLLGKEVLKTQEIREDDSKGRHTTTHREIVLLPEGGLIIDTPGMRTLSLWEVETGMEHMFGDIEDLILTCRFHNCTHETEPGCAVQAAMQQEKLDQKRWESWLKLQKEFKHLEAKKEGKIRQQGKIWGKKIKSSRKECY